MWLCPVPIGIGPGRGGEACNRELRRIPLLETVWKFSDTSQAPHHQTDHGRVDERFCASTKPPVVVAHPPVLRDPREGALHHPTPRKCFEASLWHQLLPIDLLALLGPLFSPDHRHLLRNGLFGLTYDLHTQAQNFFGPALTPSLVARIQPQVLQSRQSCAR